MTDSQLKAAGGKRLHGGWHSDSVWLLPGNIIQKKYGSGKTRLVRMEIEIKILGILKDCDFVPKIYETDLQERIVWMTYCGEKVPKTLESKTEIERLMKILDEKYGIYRVSGFSGKPVVVMIGNATKLGDRIFLIDFASLNWKIRNASL